MFSNAASWIKLGDYLLLISLFKGQITFSHSPWSCSQQILSIKATTVNTTLKYIINLVQQCTLVVFHISIFHQLSFHRSVSMWINQRHKQIRIGSDIACQIPYNNQFVVGTCGTLKCQCCLYWSHIGMFSGVC